MARTVDVDQAMVDQARQAQQTTRPKRRASDWDQGQAEQQQGKPATKKAAAKKR